MVEFSICKIHSLRNEGLSDPLSSEYNQNGIPFRAPCGVGLGGIDGQGEATKQAPFYQKKKKKRFLRDHKPKISSKFREKFNLSWQEETQRTNV